MLAAIFLAPTMANLFKSDNDEDVQPTENWLTVLDTNIEWEQNTYDINLLSGTIQANVELDAVIANVNGVGVADLTYSTKLVEGTKNTYYEHTLQASNCLLSTVFASNTTVKIDVYVEYEGRTYKVDSQNVVIKSAWTEALNMYNDYDFS